MRPLRLIKILEYYDIPLVFIGVDTINTKYLCVYDSYENEKGFIYYSVQISDFRLDDFISRRIDLRNILLHPEIDNIFFKVIVSDGNINAYSIDNIPEDSLPEEGFFLDDDEDDLDDVELITQTQSNGHTIIRLGFIDQHNTHQIDSECLSQAISTFQKTVSHCHQKLFGKQNTLEAKLNVNAFKAASFDVEFQSFSPVGLFGDSDLCVTLSKIDDLMKVTNEQELKNIANDLRGRTITSYKNFIKIMHDNRLSVKYKWVKSIADSNIVSSQIDSTRIDCLQSLLSSDKELETQILETNGIFLASSVENGKWTLRESDDENTTISGICEDYTMLSGITIERHNYHIKYKEITKENIATLKTEVVRTLLEVISL